jgi:hypothetical protein
MYESFCAYYPAGAGTVEHEQEEGYASYRDST